MLSTSISLQGNNLFSQSSFNHHAQSNSVKELNCIDFTYEWESCGNFANRY